MAEGVAAGVAVSSGIRQLPAAGAVEDEKNDARKRRPGG
jgi:hypothetical protein